MYVAELDRPWLETPFLLQGFHIQNLADIEEIQKHCEFVYVEEGFKEKRTPTEKVVAREKPRGRMLRKPSSTLPNLSRAAATRKKAQTVTRTIMDDIRLGKAIDVQAAEASVSDCVENIMSDPAAMLWMARMRTHSERVTEHAMNVTILSIMLARHLEFDAEDLHKIGLCAMLHDVGKMRVSPEILLEGRRTPEQEKEYQRHASYGHQILLSHKDLYPGAAEVAFRHHENIDGSGYPMGFSGEKILPFAKIIAVGNSYDTFTVDGVDGKALSSLNAMKMLTRYAGSRYERSYVKAFVECIGLYPSGSVVLLANGCVAIVLSQDLVHRRLPNLLVVRNDKKEVCKQKVVDLGRLHKSGTSEDWLVRDVLPNGSFGVRLEDFISKGLKLD